MKRRIVVSLILLVLLAIAPLPALGGSNTWTNLGPEGGSILSLGVSPNYAMDKTIFAGTYYGGVYKSTNGGTSWEEMNFGLSNTCVFSVAISPNFASDTTVFAGTGGGVYKSTNGGVSWTKMNTGLTNVYISSVTVSPNYAIDNTVFVGTLFGTGGGVYKSTNGGASWTLSGCENADIYSVAISPAYATDSTVLAGTYGGGVYRSKDGGTNWAQVNTGLSCINVSNVVFSPNYVVDKTIFAGTWCGIYKSTDGAASWSLVSGSPTTHDVRSIAISPTYATDGTLFAGTNGNGVFKSTNGGTSWSQTNNGLTNNTVWSMAISSSYSSDPTVFAGTYNGVHKSSNGGTNWIQSNNGLKNTGVWSVAVSPNYAADRTIFAGAFGGVFKSIDGGISWTLVNNGLYYTYVRSLSISPDYATDATVFAGIYGGVYKSTNGGTSWSSANSGLASNVVNSVAVSPNYAVDSTVFVGTDYGYGTGGAYKSTDRGASWTSINDGLANRRITSIAPSPNFATDSTVFTGTWGGVNKSTNGGTSWIPVNEGLTNTFIFSLKVSPSYANDNTVFAGTYGGGIFKSTNGGTGWVHCGLTNDYVLSIAMSPKFSTDATVFASTYGGIYKSSNGGTSWTQINGGLGAGDTYVNSIAFSPNYAVDTRVFAGTSGHGVYSYSDICPSISSITPTSGNEGTSVTINGSSFGATQGSSAVTFNGIAATVIDSWTDTKIVAKVPAGATTGDVKVTVGGMVSNGISFTVFAGCSLTRYEETNSRISWTGSWTSIADAGASGGSRKYSNDTAKPATCTYNFSGTGIRWIGTKAANRGKALVSIDGGSAFLVDLYSATTQKQSIIYENCFLGSGTHTFTITVTNTKNALSSGYYSDVDAFEAQVQPPPPPPSSPVISSITPTSGNIGTLVTINGTKFGSTQGSSTVTFNGTAATVIDSWTDTKIVAKVPTGAITGPVKVTVSSMTSNGITFTVNAGCNLNRYEQTDSHVSWAGAWSNILDAGASGGSRKYSNDTNTPATATFKFTGSCIKWIGTKAANRGKSEVWIDGGLVSTVDLYSAATMKQQVIYENSSLSSGNHIITIKVTNAKNAASTGYYSDIDAFDAAGVPTGLTRYEETESHVIYTGAWTSAIDMLASGGTRKYANNYTTPAKAVFSFTGSTIKYIGTKATNRGIAKILIDGIPIANGDTALPGDTGTNKSGIDLYAATTLRQQVLYSNTSLTSGTHTIEIRVTNVKNPLSAGYYTDIDAFEAEGV